MSIRAYKIEKRAEKSSFNITHNELLYEVLLVLGNVDDVTENGGIISIDKEYDLPVIMKEFNDIKDDYSKEQIKDFNEAIKQIKKDIENTEYKDFVLYQCF